MKLLTRAVIGAALLSIPLYCGTISISPVAANARVGDTVSFDVNISSITDLYAWQFDLGFDPTVLAAQSITEGPFLASGGSTFFLPGSIDNVAGSISFNADSLETAISGVNGSGELAVVTYSVIGIGTSPISLLNVQLLDSTLSPISVAVSSASLTTSVPETNSGILLPLSALFLLVVGKRRSRLC
jgi:general secretion pathway protein D